MNYDYDIFNDESMILPMDFDEEERPLYRKQEIYDSESKGWEDPADEFDMFPTYIN